MQQSRRGVLGGMKASVKTKLMAGFIACAATRA
jgi:hypothetical protein